MEKVKTRDYEGIGYALGALAGTVASGICVYMTKNPFSGMVCLLFAYMGGQIGKAVKQEILRGNRE